MIKRLLITTILLFYSVLSFAESWSGSGFFIAQNGYIATASHVVGNQSTGKLATSVKVVYKGVTYTAKVIAVDFKNDVAIIKIHVHDNYVYKVQPYSNPGDIVYAAGHPLGVTDTRVTNGTITDSANGWIYTNLYICHGNSGGVLLDSSNNALGVTVGVYVLGGDSYCSYASISSNITNVEMLAISKNVQLIYATTDRVVYTKGKIQSIINQTNSVPLIFGSND